jgi:hypothetical protein
MFNLITNLSLYIGYLKTTTIALRVATLTIRGLLNAHLRYELLTQCLQEKISIILLQETHFYNVNNILLIKSMFDSERYYSFGSNRSKGVGIIVLNDNITVEKFELDTEGRLTYIDIN